MAKHEVLAVEDAYGTEFDLSDGSVELLAKGGFGAPLVKYEVQQGYRQHGATVRDYALDIRDISLEVYFPAAESMSDYYANRALLHNFFRVNRAPFKLTIALADGTSRTLRQLYLNPGFTFPVQAAPDDANWQIREVLSMQAYDPIWYDTNTVEVALSTGTASEIYAGFPIGFPFGFAGFGLNFLATDLNYQGTWRTYPRMRLQGPFKTATITLIEQAISLKLYVELEADDVRIIDTDPLARTIVDANGDNRIGELVIGANDLANFHILPYPEIIGVQRLQCLMVGGVDGQSSFTVEYETRYVAI